MFIQQKATQHVLPVNAGWPSAVDFTVCYNANCLESHLNLIMFLCNGPNRNVSEIKKIYISISFTECTNDHGSPVPEKHVKPVQDCMSHSKQVKNPNLVRPVRFKLFPRLNLVLTVSVLSSTGTKLSW